ncbi:DUF5050 domain-containing protein [Brassicibacter mesophilus]|uniref:DUF5050 domain-containing protein n=1 Tax=Brassicibacter mesophilus TaxID=745119 RepID=UPI003D23BC19
MIDRNKKRSYIIVLLPLLLVLILFSTISSYKIINNRNTRIANVNNNLHNGGIVAKQGGFIYYITNSRIFVMKEDGTDKREIFKDRPRANRCLNVKDNYLYYLSDNFIIKFDIINKVKAQIEPNIKYISHLKLRNNWLYYTGWTEESGAGVFRTSIDGSETELVLEEDEFYNLFWTNDWIYYRKEDKVFRTKYNKNSKEIQLNNINPKEFVVVDKYIYYSNHEDGGKIYRADVNGNNKTKINDDNSCGLNVYGDWIYYSNIDDGMTIYKIKTNGLERIKLNDSMVIRKHIVGDWIYYQSEDDFKTYRMKTDGTSNELFE